MREGLRSSAMTANPENVTVIEEDNAITSEGDGITRHVDNVHSETSNGDGITRHGDNVENKRELEHRDPLRPGNFPCPLCNSTDTKFLFYNNKKLSQPRHYCRLCRSSWTQCETLFNQNSSTGKNITRRFEHVERGEDANVSFADVNAETSGLENGLGQKGREKISVETSDDDEEDLELGKKRRRGSPTPGKHLAEPDHAPCLRCNSTNTKFLSYNNYKLSQPRYMCNSCCKSWTHGGTIREQRVKKIRRAESSDKDKGIANLGLEEGGETNNADVSEMVGQVANLTDPEYVEDSSGETKMRVKRIGSENHKVNKGIRKDDETNTNDGNEIVAQVAYLTDPECAVDMVGPEKMEGKRNGSEESEEMECNQEANAHDDNLTCSADANAVTSGLEIGIGRQGRGRRGLENSDDKEKDFKIEKNRRQGQRGPPRSTHRREPDHAPCPRCDSTNTKFLAYNNYKLSQPRYLCNSCHKSWTRGGTIRERRGKNSRAERFVKKKCIVDSCLEEDGETKSIDGSQMVAHVANLADPDCAEDSVREREMEGMRNGSEVSEEIKHNEGADGYAHGDNHTGEPEIARGLKGRKRKWVESSVRNKDDGTLVKKVKEFFFGGMAQVVGRTLRSRTLDKNDIEKTVDVGFVEGVLGVTGKKDTDVPNKNTNEIENGDSALLIDRRKKKIKGKLHDKNWLLKASGSEKKKEMGFRENGNQQKSGKVIRGPNFLDNGKHKRLARKLCHSGQKKQKEGGDRKRSTEKQLLRNRIIDMLKSAGWTIDYRPRSGREKGREYSDAVYVSPQGRGLWSVTLAYEILRKQVESGNADSRAIAAFTPIPEEELSKLFRLTKKKMELQPGLKGQREGTNKKHKGVSQKKKFKKKNANRGTKKKSSDSDQDVLASTVQRGMQRSHRRKRQNGKRFALAVRHSKKGLDPDSKGFEQYDGKRSLLSWMIVLGTVPLGEKVQYKNHGRTEVLLEGRITRDGINCDCCNKTLTLAEFESHAGSKDPQPFQNIYLGSGSSLLQCLIDSWNKHDRSECAGIHSVDIHGGDPNDDTCNKCGDGGDLICCDGCPSTFHQNCLNIQKFPSGDWHCVYCSCKFCGIVGGSTCQNHDATDFPLLTCCLCEKKYHLLCIQVNNGVHVDSDCPSFCGEKCQEVFERLRALLGVKNQLEEGYSWTLCRRFDVNPRTSIFSDHSKIECNSKLAIALSILDECFLPIVDQRSGINMIHNVVYSCGSNFTRLNYTGFFTAILERGDEMISAASIRIHGSHSAEMPFIGTRHIYRRQGMCRRLLNAIETALCSLNVEKLVIPAISELLQTWTSVFGFMPLEESSKKEMKHMNIIVFPGVNMLEKSLLRQKFDGESRISTAGTTRTEHKTEHQTSLAHRSSDTAAVECVAFDVTSGTVKLQDSVTTVKCLVHSSVTHDNKECENNQIKDSEVSGGYDLELDGHHIEGEMNEQKNVHKLFDVSQIAPVATKCEGSLDVKGEVAEHELNGEVKAVHLSAEIMTQPQDATPFHSKAGVLQIHEPEIVASVHNDCFPLVGAFDDITEPSSQASHISNGLCKSSECHCRIDENDTCAAGVGQTSCVVTGKDILELKEAFTAAHNTDSCSLDVDSFPSRPQINANCSKESGSGSQVESHRLWNSSSLT